MKFREKLYNLVNDEPLEDIHGILMDLGVIMCSTLYTNGQGENLKEQLLNNMSEIWDNTKERIDGGNTES